MAVVFLLTVVPSGFACGAGRPPNDPTGAARTVTNRCGGCHEPPARAGYTRAALGPVVARHHARVRLAEEQWEAVLNYLAEPSGATTPTQLDR